MAYRIIIIDDEKEISTGFAQFFPWANLGFSVAGQFTDAGAALEYLRRNPVDVVISDVIMPGMTGIDLARELSTMTLTPQPLIILFSAHNEFEYARQALKYKCTDYILKSTDYDELLQIFQRIKEQLDADSFVPETDKDAETDRIINEIKEYIRENPSSANLEAAAARVYMSPSYVSRYFKQKTKSNFSDYAAVCKMELAAKLLSGLQYKIYDVSSMLGYANPVNFTRSFKKHYGISPREFRLKTLGRADPDDTETSQ